MAKVRTTPVRIRVSERGQIETVRAALEVNRENCAAGKSATGAPFPRGKGEKKQLDMSDTERLLSDVQIFTTRYQFQAPYAKHVDEKYHFAGVPEEDIPRVEAKVAALLQEEITSEEG